MLITMLYIASSSFDLSSHIGQKQWFTQTNACLSGHIGTAVKTTRTVLFVAAVVVVFVLGGKGG